ncbi:GNAT family N-acetyltransferase [Cellulomonas sp. Sa3CUA2]|uniref:GNAT family N-acetyltransferase n=2 Tax=Cellulomonas avistercoris TaxID=2762242 RepID=A0ABR8QHI4_9CELL|nr:GNAT family N-acetyltransferase [Cellulomonas avistercoris]
MVRDLSTDPYMPLTGTLPADATDAQAVAWIERQRERLRTGAGYSFCVADVTDDRALGQVGLWLAHLHEGRASAGYGVAPRERGRGVAAQALRAVTAFAWTIPGLDRVVLDVEPWNVASVRTAQRAGYRCEAGPTEQRDIGGRSAEVLRFSTTRE